MSYWLGLRFGKYEGKSLPQIIFIDPDWFFWAIEKNVFRADVNDMLAYEARMVFKKATHIRPPSLNGTKSAVEYYADPITGKFSHIRVVAESKASNWKFVPVFTRKVIDLSAPRQINKYDKDWGDLIIRQTKIILFGRELHMSRAKSEFVFGDDNNFDLSGV